MTDIRYTEGRMYVSREYMQGQKRIARWQGFGIGLAVGCALAAASINARAETPKIWWTPKQHHAWPKDKPKYCAQFPCKVKR
jgi:hypothetical protein